jgi:menaquinone-dependent protoporphyrinogen IX oxidase
MFIDLYSIVMAMKSLIVLLSYHHKNTEKIAEAMASILDAEIKTPQQIDPGRLSEYDRVGFGSGIYLGNTTRFCLTLPTNFLKSQTRKPSYSQQAAKPERPQNFTNA